MSDVANVVIKIIAEKGQIDPGQIKLDSKLKDLNISSLDVVEIVFALEEQFNIEIPFNANQAGSGAPAFERVANVIEAVESLIAGQGNAP